MVSFSILAAGLAISGLSGAIPNQESSATSSSAEILGVVAGVGVVKANDAQCAGQSCDIANLSGSTGLPIKIQPQGGDANGYKCIAKYNPAGVEAAAKAPKGPEQKNGLNGALMDAMSKLGSALPGKVTDSGTFKGRCTKNIVLFARGTTGSLDENRVVRLSNY